MEECVDNVESILSPEEEARALLQELNLEKQLLSIERDHIAEQQKRLAQQELFFQQKMAILTNGFENLEADRKQFEEYKRNWNNAHVPPNDESEGVDSGDVQQLAARLFQSVTNHLGLRKRYKDLVKIFHPDNVFGDQELIAAINEEYERRKSIK